MVPVADRQTKLAKNFSDERAVFGLYSVGISTNRDEWVYDFDDSDLSSKMLFFCRTYQNELRRFASEKPGPDSVGSWVDRSIKWTSELEQHLVKGDAAPFTTVSTASRGLYRPFVDKHHCCGRSHSQ